MGVLDKTSFRIFIDDHFRFIWEIISEPGPVSRKPRKLFGPVKPKKNLEPYNYRAVLFTFSQYRERFTSYKKFQAYTLLRFYIQMNKQWLYGPEKFPGLSRNGHLVRNHFRATTTAML